MNACTPLLLLCHVVTRAWLHVSFMRAGGLVFHIFAIVLAPYFCHFCDSWRALGRSPGTCPAGYAGAFVYVVIVMLLFHVQQDSENPFDESGLDNIFLELVCVFMMCACMLWFDKGMARGTHTHSLTLTLTLTLTHTHTHMLAHHAHTSMLPTWWASA